MEAQRNELQQSVSLKPQAFLVLLQADSTSETDVGRPYYISSGNIYIGNTPASNITLPALQRPCQLHIYQKEDQWYIKDVLPEGSRANLNAFPFLLNGLKDGNVLQIGSYVFEFCVNNGVKKRFFEQIYDSLTEDILTKAYNRRYLMNLLHWELHRYAQCEINRRTNVHLPASRPLSLLMFDLDRFGQVNKEYGHFVGDEILQGVVSRIKKRLRTTDVVSRWGGEEFYIYLPDTSHEQALELAEILRQQIAGETFPVSTKEGRLGVTISMGVSTYRPGMDMDEFMKVANQWMLKAKEQGRNRVLG